MFADTDILIGKFVDCLPRNKGGFDKETKLGYSVIYISKPHNSFLDKLIKSLHSTKVSELNRI